MPVASRVWLITGASSGIGLDLAIHASRQGDLVIAATRNPEKLKSVVKKEKNITAVKLDHNESLESIKATAKDIIAIHNNVDIIVNNAAYVQTGILEEVTSEETTKQFQTNVIGPLNVYRAFLPHMREKGSGTLVTIGSMAAWYPMPGCNMYNSTKAALRWLGIGLQGEIEQFGIKHCLIEPGFFRTELLNPTGNIGFTDAKARIPAYKEMNATVDGNFAAFHGTQLGNPVKGAQVIYEVTTSTGAAKGKQLPEFLPLGSDACDEIAKAAKKTLAAIDEWRAIGSMSDFPKDN